MKIYQKTSLVLFVRCTFSSVDYSPESVCYPRPYFVEPTPEDGSSFFIFASETLELTVYAATKFGAR